MSNNIGLTVELYGQPIGQIVGDDSRSFDFITTDATFDHFELGSRVLSESIPLETRARRNHAERRRNFFRELLPEGTILENMARQSGLSVFDTVGLLARFGTDVAGGLRIYKGDDSATRNPYTTQVNEIEIAQLLAHTNQFPLANELTSGKTSLAGVQDKIALTHLDGKWFRCHQGYPSTHILKPINQSHPMMIYDEAFALELARAVGLCTFDSQIVDFSGTPALVIQRYDRAALRHASETIIERIHQEDMLQALGVSRQHKYQIHGGHITLGRIAALFTRYNDGVSMQQLLRYLVFTIAIGNLDLHGKNLSLLHLRDQAMRLAPMYDPVPMAQHVQADGQLALSVNNIYEHRALTIHDVIAEGSAWGLRAEVANDVAHSTLELMQRQLDDIAHNENQSQGLADNIAAWISRLLKGKRVGNPTVTCD